LTDPLGPKPGQRSTVNGQPRRGEQAMAVTAANSGRTGK
jgi:hypothetical protein